MSAPPRESGQVVNNLPTEPDFHSSTTDNNAPTTTDDSATTNSSQQNIDEIVGEIQPENVQVQCSKYRSELQAKMLHLLKEMTIMVFVALAYAALTNDHPPKTSKSPAAYPFFPKDSHVTDWYRGEITKAIEEARSSDIAFVMFYAPWDAESQNARKEFALTARHMHQRVTFAAVNCWQPGGECKRQYGKVYSWPVLIAYPSHGRGVQYGGPLDAPHMTRFLQNVCKPVVVVLENYNDLISRHDAVVLANVDVLPGSLEYAVFYSSSLRFLERDPFRDVIFAVSPQSSQLQPSLNLYLWNETIPYIGSWTVDGLSSWVSKRTHQITGWVAPSGTKSISMSGYIQPGPALILFTPRNPFSDQTDLYSLLKEVAYEYYNCASDNIVTLKQRLIHMDRLKNHINYFELRKKCLKKPDAVSRPNDIVMHIPKTWTNTTLTGKKCKDCDSCDSHCVENIPQILEEICHVNRQILKPVSFSEIDDPRSPQNLQKLADEDRCRNFLMAEKYQRPIFARNTTSSETNDFSVQGLACKTNRTLTLVAMDSLRYYHFAEKLGVDLLKAKDKTAVVIVHEKLETHHIMQDDLNDLSLRIFIHNFTEGTLNRALHSNLQALSINTHIYPEMKCGIRNGEFCIAELNTDNFVPTVLKQNKAVVVFYYSKQCAFCTGISHIFLTAAKLISFVENIQFARIDGDLNLLPWEYTMETYPTILLFPLTRKAETRAFPRNIPITVPNLLGFILSNVDPVLKLQAMWSVCKQTEFKIDKAECIASLRAETLSFIETTLREWRNAELRQRPEILRKLQLLRHLHLLFAHTPEKVDSIELCLTKLNRNFDSYYWQQIKKRK